MPKNPHANFTPSLEGYTGQGAFRFWCQMALPLTYDDSLSYYELLNKVVHYLNNVISDVSDVETNVGRLATAYNQLQDYVNNYFDELDIEAELKNILDEMAEDGTLDALLSPLVDDKLPAIVDDKIDHVVADQIDDVVADQIGNTVAEQLPGIAEDQIPDTVTDWLEENVDPVGSAVIVDPTLTISGAAADAKVAGTKLKVVEGKIEDIIQPTHNLFDPSWLDEVAGIVRDEEGYWVGTGTAFNAAFQTDGFTKLTLDPTKKYYFSAVAYREGESSSTNNGLRLKFQYTDNTFSDVNFLLNDTVPVRKGVNSLTTKTVSFAAITAPGSTGITWHIKDIIIAEGAGTVEYIPHDSAVDLFARQEIAEKYEELTGALSDQYDELSDDIATKADAQDTAESIANIEADLLTKADAAETAAGFRVVEGNFKDISESTINLFDPSWLDEAEGIVRDSNGYWKGSGTSFNNAFQYYGFTKLTIDSSKKYYFAATAYREGESASTNDGLRLKFEYTDNTKSDVNFPLNTMTPERKGVNSLNTKTVSFVAITAPSVASTVWYIKDIIIAQSAGSVDYIPHDTAVDLVAREGLTHKADLNEQWNFNYLGEKVIIDNIDSVEKGENLIVVSECVNNEYFAIDDGHRVPSDQYFRSGFLPVEGGKKYLANYGRNISWWDENKEFISGSNSRGIRDGTGVVAPNNASYLVITASKSADNAENPLNWYASKRSLFSTENDIIRIPKLVSDNVRPWCYGKKLVWIGDSIVDGTDFDEFVANALHLNYGDDNDFGINGSTFAYNPNQPEPPDPDSRNPICKRFDEMPNDADIIAVSAGTNDWHYSWTNLGTIESADNGDDDNTFYGAVKHVCRGLIEKYPNKIIFFTTPIKRAEPMPGTSTIATPFTKNNKNKTLMEYADIIKEICGYYSIPVLDLYRESLLNPHISAQQTYFNDLYTHPNTSGQKIMARRVAGWITQLAYNIPNLPLSDT